MPYCARDLLAVDGMVLQSSLFLSSVTAGGRSVQGILIAIMMADPVHKRAVAPASFFRALSQSSRDTIWGRSMLLELSTLLLIRLLWFQPPSSGSGIKIVVWGCPKSTVVFDLSPIHTAAASETA